MDCPKCGRKMEQKSKDISVGFSGKQYNREIFWCDKDDVWMHLEIPVESKYA